MKTTFGFNIRVLLCPNCAAPSEVPPTGGLNYCGYCGYQSQLVPRNQTPLAPQGRGHVNEIQRLQNLRAQDGKPLLPPPALQPLMEAGQLASWKIDEAVQIWQSTRQQLSTSQDFNAAEQLLFLTMMLANHYSQTKDDMRQRAMFESALEAFSLPRHQQVMRGFLARNAVKEGDIAAAEQWIAPCDPASDDLQSDSAYRISRAMIETAKGDFNAVLKVIGRSQTEVPIMDAMDAIATVLRANAWEKLGNMQQAVEVLQQYMGEGGASGRMTIKAVIDNYASWNLCQQCLAAAEAGYAQKASATAAARAGGGVGPMLFYLGLMMLVGALVAVVLLIFGYSTGGVIPGPLIAGVIMTLIGRGIKKAAEKAAYLRTHGIQTMGKVLQVSRTGTKINNVPQYQITLQITLEGSQHQVSTKMLMDPSSAGQFKAGLSLPVRVDPKDPQSVMLELD